MRIRRGALPALLTAIALAAPAAAQGATLTATVTKPCYGTNDRVALAGTGFTPNGQVTLMQGQRTLNPAATADAAGNLGGRAIVQPISSDEERSPYTATDQTNPAIAAATAPIRFSRTTIVGTIFFDTYRRYRKGRTQQLRGTFTVDRRARSSAAAGAAGLSSLRPVRGSR